MAQRGRPRMTEEQKLEAKLRREALKKEEKEKKKAERLRLKQEKKEQEQEEKRQLKLQKLQEKNETKQVLMDMKDQYAVVKEEISEAKRDNYINGEYLPEFMFHKFINRLDPVEYCHNVLRAHLPESKRYLHSNQIELLRAACHPKIKQVGGIMSRQCIAKDTFIFDRDGNIVKIQDYSGAWLTRKNADIIEIKLKNNFSIKCTGNHPIMTDRGWVNADKIQYIDKICCLTGLDNFPKDNGYSDILAELAGWVYTSYIVGTPGHIICFTVDIRNRIKNLLSRYPDIAYHETENEIIIDDIEFISNILDITDDIPYGVNKFTRTQLYAFTRAIGLQLLKHYKKKNIHCYKIYMGSSENIVNFFKMCLYKIGIHINIKEEKGKYFIIIDDEYNTGLYNILIGHNIICTSEPERLDELKFFNNKYKHFTEYGPDGEKLVYFPIVSIRAAGKADVYDASFPGKLWFIANGIKVHNSGKCFAPGTVITMANGEGKRVEDIRLGDAVMGIDSKPKKVKALGHGYDEMYDIVPLETGYESYTVNSEHILALKDKNNKSVNISVKDFLELPEEEQKQYYGYRGNVSYQKCETYMEPYIYGTVLCADPVALENSGPLPEEYFDQFLFNSVDVKRKVLAGLIDTYGKWTGDNTVEIKCHSDIQRLGIARMAHDVGLKAGYVMKYSFNSYILPLTGDMAKLPLRSVDPKPFDSGIPVPGDSSRLFRFKVVPMGMGEYFGFSLEGKEKDKLFLLYDNTVVHNTETIASIAGDLLDNYPQMRIGIFTPRLQQAEVSLGRLSKFYQMNEDRLNNKIEVINKDKIMLSNGSYVSAVSASDQSNIEGLTFDVIILDEAQKISDYTWSERIGPMGSATNAKLIKIGTPKTRNHFYDSIEGPSSVHWHVVRKDWTQCEQLWALDAIYLPDKDTGEIRPYSRYVVEKMMPKSLKQWYFPNSPEIWSEGAMSVEDFKTQYMLQFIDGAGKFLTSEELDRMTNGNFEWLDDGVLGEVYMAGIDFAGSNPDGDNTQISVVRVNPDRSVHKVFGVEFNNMTYPVQMYEINKLFGGIAPRFRVQKIFADYTGCGAAIIQTLQQEFGLTQMEGIIFNAKDRYTNSGMNMKNIMYAKLQQAIDSDKFKYPSKQKFVDSIADSAGKDNLNYYHRMVGEWYDLEMEVRHTVNKKIEAPVGMHDDVCDADALAYFGTVARSRSMPRISRATIYRW